MSDMDAKGWCTGYRFNCRKQSVPLHHIKPFPFHNFNMVVVDLPGHSSRRLLQYFDLKFEVPASPASLK